MAPRPPAPPGCGGPAWPCGAGAPWANNDKPAADTIAAVTRWSLLFFTMAKQNNR